MSDETPKKMWLAGAVAVVVICASGFYLARGFMKPQTAPDVDVGRAVAEKFVAAMRGGKPGDAWDAATAEFKSIEGREAFIRKVKSTPILTEPLQFNSSQSVTVQEQPRLEYLFQSPKAKMVRVLIGPERGDWKVDRLTL